MLLLGLLGLRSTHALSLGKGAALLLGASLLLAGVYRLLPSGLAPALNESIGWQGWLATVLTVAVPLGAVMVAARLARSRLSSPLGRAVVVAGAGIVALIAYPTYGLLLYCGITGICP